MKLIKVTAKTISKKRIEKIFGWSNDPEITKFFKSKSRTIEKIKEILSRPKTYNFIINEGEEDVGYIFTTNYSEYAYLTIMIEKGHWGKSYGKQAMILIENKLHKLKAKKIILGLYKKNKRAFNLYQDLGYVQVKKGNIITMEKNL